ncbi:MAG: hypothetical protein ACJ71K_13450 [Nitrososphaeraceae archaeon]
MTSAPVDANKELRDRGGGGGGGGGGGRGVLITYIDTETMPGGSSYRAYFRLSRCSLSCAPPKQK